MKSSIIHIITTMIISIAVNNSFISQNKTLSSKEKKDTSNYYWQPDYDVYKFDTVVNHIAYKIKTYCLNDSAVYNETFSEERDKNKNLIEFSVAHNYATDIIIKYADSRIKKIHLRKEDFKNSLSPKFIKIAHMCKNQFSHVYHNQLIFRATFAKPDTDYQIAILYMITNQGKLKILKLEDESYNSSVD